MAIYPHFIKRRPGIDLAWISAKIREAIEERPSRRAHGYTSKNAFYITKDGRILAYNEFSKLSPVDNPISVHSHSPENWAVGEEFQPLNAGDLDALRWHIKRGYGNKMIVIMADGRMDYLEVPKMAQPRFSNLGMKTLELIAEASREEAKEGWEQHGIKTYESDRIKLLQFADAYGLIFLENLNWERM